MTLCYHSEHIIGNKKMVLHLVPKESEGPKLQQKGFKKTEVDTKLKKTENGVQKPLFSVFVTFLIFILSF